MTIGWARTGTSGLLKGVRRAATGVLNLVNVTAPSPTGDLPLAFADSATTGSLSGWTVKVNGVAVSNRKLVWANDKLALLPPGLTIIFR